MVSLSPEGRKILISYMHQETFLERIQNHLRENSATLTPLSSHLTHVFFNDKTVYRALQMCTQVYQ